MTWRIDGPQGHETSKTRWRAVPYTRGRGLDLGCGQDKIWNTKNVIGADSNKDAGLFGIHCNPDMQCDVTQLAVFASRSMDFVYSSHVLEHIEPARTVEVLREWCRLVKKGGHLVLYLPLQGLYPNPGEAGCNPDHKLPITFAYIDDCMQQVARDWDLVTYEVCDQDDEYSGFWAYKMLNE